MFRALALRQRETALHSDEGPMLEALDYTTRIGSTPTFLYFDLVFIFLFVSQHCLRSTLRLFRYRRTISWRCCFLFPFLVMIVGNLFEYVYDKAHMALMRLQHHRCSWITTVNKKFHFV